MNNVPDDWPRIAGIDLQDNGVLGAVWIARDPIADVGHVIDCAVFQRESEVIISHALNARGRRIPIAWEKRDKAMADALGKLGCNMLPEPVDDDDAMAEVVSRNIWTRMRAQRFRVERSLSEWLAEFRDFRREDAKIPKEGRPLMAATRYAVWSFDYARPIADKAGARTTYPKLAIL